MSQITKKLIETLGENGLLQALRREGIRDINAATDEQLLSIYNKTRRMGRPNVTVSEPTGDEVAKYGAFINKKETLPPRTGTEVVPEAPAAKDATVWEQPLAAETFAPETPSSPGLFNRNRGKLAAGAGTVAAAGGAAALMNRGATGEWEDPPTESLPGEESPLEQKSAPAPISGDSSESTYGTVTLQKGKDFVGSLAEPPANADVSDWNTKLAGIADQRMKGIDQLKADIATAKATADVARESIEKRELAEKLTNAIGQIVSGMYGLKHGLDMSGTKFTVTDWNQKLQNVRQDLNDSIARLRENQALDQAVISERKDALLQSKEDAYKAYQSEWMKYNAKVQKAGAQQSLDTSNRTLQLDADKFNATIRQKAAEERAKGKSEKDIGISVRKDKEERLNRLKDEYRKTAEELSGASGTVWPGNSDEQDVKLRQLEALDREIEKISGVPYAYGKDKATGAPIPLDYGKIDPSNLSTLLQNVNNGEANLAATFASFQHPQLQGIKGTYIKNRAQFISQAANAYIASGMSADAADEKARADYAEGLRQMFQMEVQYRSKGRK